MGMYTKLWFDAEFKRKLNDIDEQALRYLFNYAEKPYVLPNHPFFAKERSEYMFSSPAYSGAGVTLHLGDCERHVTAHIAIKNYDDEIEYFLDYVRPLLDNEEGTCIGWTWFETEENPTLIYA